MSVPRRSQSNTFTLEVNRPAAREARPDKGKRRASRTPTEDERPSRRKRRTVDVTAGQTPEVTPLLHCLCSR